MDKEEQRKERICRCCSKKMKEEDKHEICWRCRIKLWWKKNGRTVLAFGASAIGAIILEKLKQNNDTQCGGSLNEAVLPDDEDSVDELIAIYKESRAGLDPYDPNDWGITYREYNKLADWVEQSGSSYNARIVNGKKYEFRSHLTSVDEFLRSQSRNNAFQTSNNRIRESITTEEFEEIVDECLGSDSSVMDYELCGEASIRVHFFSNKGKNGDTVRISFNDNGRITGWYEIGHIKYPGDRKPSKVADKIKHFIQSALYRE